jgi:hypothetical protein
MEAIKKILQHLFTLITGIIMLGYKVIKQIVLPAGGKKGNLLSSLFTFIVGILEGLIHFEHDLLKVPMLFRNKYIRQGLQIAAAIFLFIGSWEWSAVAPDNNQITLRSVQNITQAPVQENIEQHPVQSSTLFFALSSIAFGSILYSPDTPQGTKKYVLICCFRI